MVKVCKIEGCNSSEFYPWQFSGGRTPNLCKTHEKERGRASYKKHKEKVLKRQKKEYGSLAWARQRAMWFNQYDKRQGLPSDGDITGSVLLEISKMPCFYCGETYKVGMDRIENTRGHEIKNVIPCCCSCNLTRGDRFSVKEFLEIAKTIKIVKQRRQLTFTDNVNYFERNT